MGTMLRGLMLRVAAQGSLTPYAATRRAAMICTPMRLSICHFWLILHTFVCKFGAMMNLGHCGLRGVISLWRRCLQCREMYEPICVQRYAAC